MDYFVKEDSIVRRIWGRSDTILFIFAGAAAEFALSKAVDWLYYTGKLPADPLGRLFSTVSYARKIVFSEEKHALTAIDSITAIHQNVENSRGVKIQDWAYRDVLFMLIDYSIRSFEVLERNLTMEEKQEVFYVFNRVGLRMGIKGLPQDFNEWQKMREAHLRANLQYSVYTDDLFRQYQKHLGIIRYNILLNTQALLVPMHVRKLLGIRRSMHFNLLLKSYKLSRKVKLDWLVKEMILPAKYKQEVKAMDMSRVWI